MKLPKIAGVAVLAALVVLTAPGQRASAQGPNATQAAVVSPKVIELEGNLEADDLIMVRVENLGAWAAENHDPAKLVPFLNGLALRGNYPEEVHLTENHLRFHLQITPDNKKMWIDLLGAPEGIRKRVAFSVGLEGQSQFDTVFGRDNPALLTVISPWYGVVSLVIVAATLILLVWLARNTNIIREPGPKPMGGKLRPYNLGRAQMAFWFFFVYTSYIAIWLITDALDTITPSLLGLMGISAGTALSEALIDSGKDAAAANKLNDLTAERKSLEQGIPEIQSQIGLLQGKEAMTPEDLTNRDSLNKQLQESRTRLGQVNQEIHDLAPSVAPAVSAGFLRDILSDGHGYSFHRFQIFAWTIILGVIFVSSVYNGLTMPEFSTTLLGLMGISSGTYIGFKFPEQR